VLLASLRGKDASVVMESTNTLWIKLYDVLEEEGIPVVLANPYKTRVIAESNSTVRFFYFLSVSYTS
jgi:transposase